MEVLTAVSEGIASICRTEFIILIGMLDAIGIHNMNFYAVVDLAYSVGLHSRSSVFISAKSINSVLRTLHRTETGRMVGSNKVSLPARGIRCCKRL